MALRLRRGADAERLGITPLAGELIYTTDTKKLYVGDGLTAGGIAIDTAGGISIDGLVDVDTSTLTPTIGWVLKWNGTNWVPAEETAISGGVVAGGDYKINIVGNDSTVLVNTDTNAIVGTFTGPLDGNVVGNVTGDVVGSVFADDSSVLVDAVNNIHYGLFNGDIVSNNGLVFIKNSGDDSTNIPMTVNITSTENQSVLKLIRGSTNDISNDTETYGQILFQRSDVNGDLSTALIAGSESGLLLSGDTTGLHNDVSSFLNIFNGNVGLGVFQPSEKLEVVGNTKVSGFVQFGSLTTTERDSLTPSNGTVVYNSTDNRFQGYQDNLWINLGDNSAA